MSNEPETSARKALVTRLWNKAIDWAFMAVLVAVCAAIFAPVRQYVGFMAKLPETISDIRAVGQQNGREIQKLRIPRDIFSLSQRSSGAVDGFCESGKSCRINVRVRRDENALSCTLVPELIEWFYRNPRDNEEHSVTQLSGEPKDVGTGFKNFEFQITTPFGLTPDAELCLNPAYTGCPGQYKDDPPISPDTECMDVDIR